MSITDEELINRGYHRYEPTQFDVSWVCDRFQKRFDDKVGKKYFIDFVKYDNAEMIEHEKKRGVLNPDYIPRYSYEIETQMNKKDKAFNVDLLSSWNDNIDEVEQFIEDMWNKLELDYYERW